MKAQRVYLLGAGCSASYRYPLAKDFLGELRRYGDGLQNRAKCERLRSNVADTVALMDRLRTEVIGYSFDANDRKSVMELLRQMPQTCEIIIWNPEAEVICNDLQLSYPGLAGSIKPLVKPF